MFPACRLTPPTWIESLFGISLIALTGWWPRAQLDVGWNSYIMPKVNWSKGLNMLCSAHSGDFLCKLQLYWGLGRKVKVQSVSPRRIYTDNLQFVQALNLCSWGFFFHVFAGNSKQGLRCKACKLAAHLWCSAELSQQPCSGKVRVFTAHLLLLDRSQSVVLNIKLTVLPLTLQHISEGKILQQPGLSHTGVCIFS